MQATTIVAVDMPTLRDLSEVIVLGVVTGARDGRQPFTTEVTIRVTESFKGAFKAGDEIPIKVERGEEGGVVREAVGEAHYRPGQRTIVFLENVDGDWVTLGLSYGKFDVFTGRNGRDMAVRSPEGLDLAGLTVSDPEGQPVSLDNLRNALADDIAAKQKK